MYHTYVFIWHMICSWKLVDSIDFSVHKKDQIRIEGRKLTEPLDLGKNPLFCPASYTSSHETHHRPPLEGTKSTESIISRPPYPPPRMMITAKVEALGSFEKDVNDRQGLDSAVGFRCLWARNLVHVLHLEEKPSAAQSPPADGVWKNNLAPGEVSRREGSVSEVGESWDGLLDVNII